MNTTDARFRLVLRVVLLQAGCASVTGAVFGVFMGGAAALGAFFGGMIVAVGTALFGWRMFSPGIAAPGRLFSAMVAAESLKWLWFVAAVWAGLVPLKLAPGPLITGVAAGQLGHWLSLIIAKRG